jgi:phosphatidylglycerol---prolipoprotein diacylglyceryl transferase
MNFLHYFHPSAIAWHIGALSIHWYGIIIASALIIGFLIALYTSKQKQVQSDHLYNLFLLLVIFGVIGGRLAHIITDWSYYQQHLSEMIKIWHGGLAFHGVALAGLATAYVYCRAKKVPFWLLTDSIIVAVPLMQALGRWGNYFNQELFGQPTNSAWGIPIDWVNRPVGFQHEAFFQPLFLFESLLDLVIFVILLILFKKHKLTSGRLTLLYFVLYSVVRFCLDFIRLEPAKLGPLTWGQWISLVLFSAAIMLWVWLKKKTSLPPPSK